jgi:3-oxoacyl-[acyl-carrier protein] reductase
MALAFGEAGWNVAVTAHRGASGQAVADAICRAGGSAVGMETDVTDGAALAAAFVGTAARWGGIDAVVHNAISNRSNEPVALETAPTALWEEHAAVAVRAMYEVARLAHPHLAAVGGSLLVLQSPAGIQGSERLSLYAMAKGFQRGFVKSLAREWGASGIRVNGLAPLAMTDALEQAMRNDPTMHDRLTAVIPAGRFGDPCADIGPCAVWLCGDGARYVTGQTLVVSGGRFTAL